MLAVDDNAAFRDRTSRIRTANGHDVIEAGNIAEHAALRRVAQLGASGLPPPEVLEAVAVEASALMDDRSVTLVRLEDDGHGVVVAVSSAHAPLGLRFALEGDSVAARILRSGRAERIDDYASLPSISPAEDLGVRAAVGVPITINGRLWGMLGAVSADEPLPVGTEQHLSNFAEIASAAISSAQTRLNFQQLADEQAALLRVAQLVARGTAETELFDAVAVEASGLIGGEGANLVRFDGPRTFTIIATCGGPAPVGLKVEVPEDDDGTAREVIRTHRPARRDNHRTSAAPLFSDRPVGLGSSVSVPIIVEGRLWGLLGCVTEGRRLPTGTEHRLQQFAELVAAAIANAQARAEVQQLADEQSALLRVAELVAGEASGPELFDAVATEAAGLINNEATTLVRYEGNRTFTIIATRGGPVPVGTSVVVPLDDEGSMSRMLREKRPNRLDDYASAPGPHFTRERYGLGSAVSVPIMVEGELWGMLGCLTEGRRLPTGTEDRLQKFAELAAASIANAENRNKLTASRARVVATADETRRRLQRDVHDSAQQRLVHTIITLKLAKDAITKGKSVAKLIDEALENAQRANSDLRDVVHGILPTALSRGGLRAGLESLLADFSLTVELTADIPRLPTDVETTAYFIAAETLTNVVKHARASATSLTLAINNTNLEIEIRDDGIGGADPSDGSGLTGLRDRVEASNGTLIITSPAGGGTTVCAVLPIRLDAGAARHA